MNEVVIEGIKCYEYNRDSLKKDVLISVYCLTYNHVNYITECLEGILAQKTQYKYEIVIIDDIESFSECQNERFSEYKIYYDILRRLKGENVNHSLIQVKNI